MYILNNELINKTNNSIFHVVAAIDNEEAVHLSMVINKLIGTFTKSFKTTEE